jgi:hypothetical protein
MMAALIRIVNAFYAALFLAAAFYALVVAASAPRAIPVALATLALLLGSLCFANMRRREGLAMIAANAAAALLALAGLAAADPALHWVGGVSILPFAITLPALIAARARA